MLFLDFYARSKRKPATPDERTSSHGDHFQNCSKPNAARAMINATDESTAAVHTGLYRAASKIPTTAAFAPRSAACAPVLRRRLLQNGSAPRSNRKEGRKIHARHHNPEKPLCPMTVPR